MEFHNTAKCNKPLRSARRPSLSDDQLLDVALRLFLNQGVERTNVESITNGAGMAKRTFYQRFGSKEAVLNSAVLRGVKQWIVPPERLRAAETNDLQSSLEA